MSIYWSRAFPRSNSSFFLRSGYPSKSSVIRLREDNFLMDTGRGTPKIRMKDELTNVPQYPARFENTVGYSFNVVAGALKKRGNYESFFMDLVAGESRIKERAAANLNSFLGPLEVVAGEPLVLPQRFRENQARKELQSAIRWKISKNLRARIEKTHSRILEMQKNIEAVGSRKKQTEKTKKKLDELNNVLAKAHKDLGNEQQRLFDFVEASRKKKKAKPRAAGRRDQIKKINLFEGNKLQEIPLPSPGIILSRAKRKKRKGVLVGVAGFIFLFFFKKKQKRKLVTKKKKRKPSKNSFSEKRHLFTY